GWPPSPSLDAVSERLPGPPDRNSCEIPRLDSGAIRGTRAGDAAGAYGASFAHTTSSSIVALHQTPPRPPKLLDHVRAALRTRHHSRRTEEAYLGWVRRFIIFHGLRHPRDMGEPEIAGYLSHLAVDGRVSASTQNQALCALLFLYKEV